MAYFPDLAEYSYGSGIHPNVVHVGWLDAEHPFQTGAVEAQLLAKLKAMANKPVELYRGKHLCELCIAPADIVRTFVAGRGTAIDPNCSWMRWAESRMGNGEIRVGDESLTFAAPVLIVHYIEEHRYLPPAEFLEAVQKASIM